MIFKGEKPYETTLEGTQQPLAVLIPHTIPQHVTFLLFQVENNRNKGAKGKN